LMKTFISCKLRIRSCHASFMYDCNPFYYKSQEMYVRLYHGKGLISLNRKLYILNGVFEEAVTVIVFFRVSYS